MKQYAYALGPIDFGWENLATVEATAINIASLDAREMVLSSIGASGITLEMFIGRWTAAQATAKHAGWEGDFRHAPVVFWIPIEDSFECGFVIKQDNNGETFVISPIPMPHLED